MGGGAHVRFLARTILVRDNDIEKAYKQLEKILKNDDVMKIARRQRYFEKPHLTRSRLAYERCKRLYDGEMKRKIEFVLRKNRADPFIYD